jgi:hypothetical protein
MDRRILAFVSLFVLVSAHSAWGDGKIYGRDLIPPGIPYQRALLVFDGTHETLLLQAQFESRTDKPEGFPGWVVPVPQVPELGSMDSGNTHALFQMMERLCRPDVTQIGLILYMCVFLGLFPASCLGAIIGLVFRKRWLAGARTEEEKRRRLRLLRWIWASACILFILNVVIAFIIPNFISFGTAPVEVVKAEKVGVYDVQVIRSDEPEAIIEWLRQNAFRFDESDTLVLDRYVRRGWFFVAGKIDPSTSAGKVAATRGGLLDPLILRFPAQVPIYPLALTSTIGQDLELRLYVLASHKVAADSRLELVFAGDSKDILNVLDPSAEPKGLLLGNPERRAYILCKFKATLTPAQMKEDLTFGFAADNEPYRQHVYAWR